MSFSKIIIIGNLGRDAEVRYTVQGIQVCDFTVATNEKRRNQNGEIENVTTWFRVNLWGKQVENISRYLTRGKQVLVEGRLRVDEWTDREGRNRYTLVINATDVRLLGSKPEEGDEIEEVSEEAIRSGDFKDDKDDIPF
jgi:single-strand DNA-binding protein